MTELREALMHARDADGVFRDSLENFAAIGPEPSAAAQGTIARLEGIMAALDEYRDQADESVAALREIARRLGG